MLQESKLDSATDTDGFIFGELKLHHLLVLLLLLAFSSSLWAESGNARQQAHDTSNIFAEMEAAQQARLLLSKRRCESNMEHRLQDAEMIGGKIYQRFQVTVFDWSFQHVSWYTQQYLPKLSTEHQQYQWHVIQELVKAIGEDDWIAILDKSLPASV